MSASREKKARKDGGVPQANPQQAAAKAKTRKNVLTGIAVALVVVLIIGSIVLFKGPYFRTHSVAVTTGTHELAPITVRYFYQDAFTQFYQTYGSMLGSVYASGSDISTQVYDEETGKTWGDALMESAIEQIRTTYAVYDDAVANGYVLSEAGETALSNTESMITMYATLSQVSENDYLRATYGNGASLQSYLDYQRILVTASYYQQENRDSYTYTADELNAAYEESPADYNVYSYHTYLIRPDSTSESTDEESEAAKAEALEKAENMAAASENDLEQYLALCNELSGTENYTDGTMSLRENYRASSMSDEVKAWVTDAARQEGDTTVIETESGDYVLYFVSVGTNDYDALNIRSIKISATTTDDSGNTVADWDTAKTQLDAFQAELDAADDPLTALDDLAKTYSSDTNTKYDGGKYETVHRGQFESAVDDWLFDETHAAGDTTVIEGSDGYYFLYVEGSAGSYRDYLVDQALRNSDYSDWYNALVENATAEENDFGMGHVVRTLTVPSQSASSSSN